MKIQPNKTKVLWTSKETGRKCTSTVVSHHGSTVWVGKRNGMMVPMLAGSYEVVQ